MQARKYSTHCAVIALAFSVVLGGCTSEEKPNQLPTIKTYAIGVREPETVSAQNAPIDDKDLVIGVKVGDKYRAYWVKALSPPGGFDAQKASPELMQMLGRHIVNDVVAGVPITVTHCDVNGCSRVFTGEGDQSLDLAVSGTRDGQLELSLLRSQFLQKDPQAPLADYPFELVPWSQWKATHPDTDAYIGPYLD